MYDKIFRLGYVSVLLMFMKDSNTTPVAHYSRDGDNVPNQAVVIIPNFPLKLLNTSDEMDRLEAAVSRSEKVADKMEGLVNKIDEAVNKKKGNKEEEVGMIEEKIVDFVVPTYPSVNHAPVTTSDREEEEEGVEVGVEEGLLPSKNYYVYKYIEASFKDARSECEKRGYRLASIENQEEYKLLINRLKEKYDPSDAFWTSGSDLQNPREYIWESTGKPIPRNNWWQPGEPNNALHYGEYEHCVELKVNEGKESDQTYVLNDIPCSRMIPFICEKETMGPTSNLKFEYDTTSESSSTTYLFSDGHSKRYLVYTNLLVDFETANSVCEAKGTHLASIKNQEEYELLTNHLTSTYSQRAEFWTSGNNLEDYDEFVWGSSDSPVPLNDWWLSGEPSLKDYTGQEEHCVELRGKGIFVLNDISCSEERYPICEMVIEGYSPDNTLDSQDYAGNEVEATEYNFASDEVI